MSTSFGISEAEETSVAERAVEKGKETAEQGLEKAKEAAGEARGVAVRQLDERSTQVGKQATSVSESLRRLGSQLREEGQAQPAGLAEKAAEQAQRVGSYLEQGSGEQFVQDLEQFTRRRPWVVASGAFFVGIAASRFLKASAERRAETGNGASFDSRRPSSGVELPPRLGVTSEQLGLR